MDDCGKFAARNHETLGVETVNAMKYEDFGPSSGRNKSAGPVLNLSHDGNASRPSK